MSGPVVAARCALAFITLTAAAQQGRAETFVEHSAEFRMQLDFVVPDAALRKFLPVGWEPNIATQGPAKDCNLRLIFIDRVDITDANGAPTGSNRLVYLAAPVKQSGSNVCMSPPSFSRFSVSSHRSVVDSCRRKTTARRRRKPPSSDMSSGRNGSEEART